MMSRIWLTVGMLLALGATTGFMSLSDRLLSVAPATVSAAASVYWTDDGAYQRTASRTVWTDGGALQTP